MNRLPGHPQAVSAACVCDICIAIEHENAMRIVDDLIRCCTVFALLSVGPRLPLRPRKDGLWLVQGDKRRDIKRQLEEEEACIQGSHHGGTLEASRIFWAHAGRGQP